MSLDYPGLLAELQEESDRLIDLLRRLMPDQWRLTTPAPGWTIHDQITHLAFFDDTARMAMTEPARFRHDADELMAGGMDFPDRIAEQHRGDSPGEVLDWFMRARSDLLAAFGQDEPKRRLPWFGPEMSVASSATARLMETWAHGQDIYDALSLEHPPSAGLRSIAHLGVATFAFSHKLNGMDVPEEQVRVTLESPQSETWTWGPADAVNSVDGKAVDFVLAVTQRRHWSQTTLAVKGPLAVGWLDIAQAFAGAATRRAVH